jgi:hypothetical protein
MDAMNNMEREFNSEEPAEIEYLDGDFRVVKPGAFVVCAVTGVHIPLDALRYWSADLQEAYATAGIALKRFREAGKTP